VSSRPRQDDTVFEGVLLPVVWTSAGEVAEVSLMTFDEAEYRIEAGAAAAYGLRDHLRRRVRLRGRIRDGRVVEIASVEILPSRTTDP
jgi:hypothetical protein